MKKLISVLKEKMKKNDSFFSRIFNLFVFFNMFLISHILVDVIVVDHLILYDVEFLVTFIGVLGGFCFTAYALISAISDNMFQKLEWLNKKDHVNGEVVKPIELNSAVTKLKESISNLNLGIKRIFFTLFSFIPFLVFIGISEVTINPFGWKLESLLVPQKLYVSVFLYSMILFYKIVNLMFRIQEGNRDLFDV